MNAKKSAVMLKSVVVAGLACVLVSCEAKESEKAASTPTPAAPPAASAPPKAPEPTMEELNAFKPPTAKGKVFFKELKDGAKLGGKAFMGAVAVKLAARCRRHDQVEPAGAVRENAGHFAVGIDAQPVPPGHGHQEGQRLPGIRKRGEPRFRSA